MLQPNMLQPLSKNTKNTNLLYKFCIFFYITQVEYLFWKALCLNFKLGIQAEYHQEYLEFRILKITKSITAIKDELKQTLVKFCLAAQMDKVRIFW